MPYKKPKPSITIDETELPAIKTWEVGQTYLITAKVKMTFQSQGDEYESYNPEGGTEKPKMRGRLKFLSITPIKEKKSKIGKTLMRKPR